jgi:hypothetical protein
MTHEPNPLLSHRLRDIARNWNTKAVSELFPANLWPGGQKDQYGWGEEIIILLHDVSQYEINPPKNIVEEVEENVGRRLQSDDINQTTWMTPQDLQQTLSYLKESEAAGVMYRRPPGAYGHYKEELLDHIRTTWGVEPIDIIPEDMRPHDIDDTDLNAWFRPFIPILSAMTVKCLYTEQMQGSFRVQVENRKRQPKGVGRPKKEDSEENIGILRVCDVKKAHQALVEEQLNRKTGMNFSATESVRGEESLGRHTAL